MLDPLSPDSYFPELMNNNTIIPSAIIRQHLYLSRLEGTCDAITERLKNNETGKDNVSKEEFRIFRQAAQELCAPQNFVLGSLFKNIAGTSKTPKTHIFNIIAMSFTGAMSADISGKNEITGKDFSPFSVIYGMTPTEIFRLAKPFPISFQNEHIDERLQERAGIPLNFSDSSVLESLQLAIAFLYVMGPELGKKNIPMLPLLVPHRDGLLLGHIETSPESIFCAHGSHASRNQSDFQEVNGTRGAGNDWKAKARVYFKTYIGSNEVKGAQNNVTQQWKAIIKRHTATINQISDAYTDYNGGVEVDEQGWIDFMEKILVLYRSREWQECASYGMKHVPDRTYADIEATRLGELVDRFSPR
ncbi:MAG: hypothetical protein ACRBCT_05505 [Alphaproteobacteria bacterium]